MRRLKARIDARLARHGELGSKLIKGVVGTTGIRLGHAALGFVVAILLARSLGPSGYGAYSFVMALVAFLTIPSELGIPGLAVREIAVANARKDWGHMRGFTIRAHQGIAILSVVLMSAGAVALLVAGDRIDPVRRECMWLGLALVPLISLGALRGAMLRGLRKVLLGQLPEQIIRPGMLAILIFALWALGSGQLSAPDVVGAQIVATSVAFLWGLYTFLKLRPAGVATAEPVFRTREWIRSTLPFGLTAMLALVNGRTDILALGLFREDSEVGIYRVAVQLALPGHLRATGCQYDPGAPHRPPVLDRRHEAAPEDDHAQRAGRARRRRSRGDRDPAVRRVPDPGDVRRRIHGGPCAAHDPGSRPARECGHGFRRIAAEHDRSRTRHHARGHDRRRREPGAESSR